jgi:hypothetical protein
MFGLFKKKTEPAAAPAGTYSFRATGISFNCRFPSSRFKGRIRQFVLDKCRTGDPVTLKIYEWEGAPALAVMADKYETDIGVVPVDQVRKILPILQRYKVKGKIIDIRILNPDEEDYQKIRKIFDVELAYYE